MVNFISTDQAENEAEQPFDTSDKEQVNKVRKKSARTRADRLRFIEAAMKHPEGRAWFYDHMLRCHLWGSPYVSESPYDTAYRCGEQNIAKMVLDDIQTAAPEQYLIMINENKSRNG